MEEWRVIPDYPNYAVSNKGNVKRLIGGRGKCKANCMIKANANTHGYLFIRLCNNCDAKCKTIHRLVATAFLENPENKPCVDHKDGNKKNNVLENLRWATKTENQGNRVGSCKSGYKGVYLHSGKYISMISKNKKSYWLGTFETAEQASEAYAKAAKEHFGEFAKY